MRKVVSALVCVLLILVQALVVLPQKPINHGGKIESRYDGVAFETVMRLRKMKVDCEGFKDNFKDGCVSIDVALHCPGAQVRYVGRSRCSLFSKPRVGISRTDPTNGSLDRYRCPDAEGRTNASRTEGSDTVMQER